MILILGGTTEGRAAVRVVQEAGKPYFYSTKGEEQEIACPHGTRLTGALDLRAMVNLCRQCGIRLLIDAAHPFATLLHDTVAQCARELQLPVIRYERTYTEQTPDVIWCEDYTDAIQQLEKMQVSRVLFLTGVQTISKLRDYWSRHPDCFFRILDREESLQQAEAQGIDRKHLLFYDTQTPLKNVLKHIRPQAILTKESGISGGFDEKAKAARETGIPLLAVRRPALPECFISVSGEITLRKQIERLLPDYFPLRIGYTTGTCATAAAKAALLTLLTDREVHEVCITLPSGEVINLPVKETPRDATELPTATASVIKDAGDDPDITNGMTVCATVTLTDKAGIRFLQGEGVGRVTLPGLGLPVGEPAINRTPREMITRELSTLYDGGMEVRISIPGGRELAQRTFNPRLGIVDGISIIGTSGIVRPFSAEAFVDAIRKQMQVALATGSSRIFINSGAKSEGYLKALYPGENPQHFIHYGNFIGETLKSAAQLGVREITMGIMIGKAVKLAEGHLDTHSKKAVLNKTFLRQTAQAAGCDSGTIHAIESMTLARELWSQLSAEQADRFFNLLLTRCLKHCAPLVPTSRLTLLLIDEKGRVPYRISQDCNIDNP